ncbi:hypothetical protein ACFL43_03875 [Thermodesulfobacteriota bacterium]
MDALIRAKVCRVLREPFLNPRLRTGLIFSALSITSKKERWKFNIILDSFLDEIKTNNQLKGSNNDSTIQTDFQESSKKAQAYC